MYCPRCGAENPDNKTLCARCRKPLAVGSVRFVASTQPAAPGHQPQQQHQHRKGQ